MSSDLLTTVIIRHPKERISKCSLKGLHDRSSLRFIKARPGFTYDASCHTVLALDSPVLSKSDAERPLLLLDSTWRLLPQLKQCLRGEPVCRSLPPDVKTAYPRKSKLTEDPLQGLASVEALYLSLRILGVNDISILDDYHWKDTFMAINGIS